MEKADQHDACDEVRKRRRCCQQKPCGFAAALGRRQRVAHNSTGPTSVSIDFKIQKGSWGRPEGSIAATGARSVRQARSLGNIRRSGNRFSSCLSYSKALPWERLASIRDAVLLRPELAALWSECGLSSVQETALTIWMEFRDFADYWAGWTWAQND